jgi:hypothetical protein
MAIIKVKTGGITADAITDALIADDVVGTEHLTANEVDTTALGADAVTGAQLADDAVNSEHYTDGSVDTAHIADAQITTAKLSTAVLTGATDIGANLADADLFLVDDGAGGTLRKSAMSRIKTYVDAESNTPSFFARGAAATAVANATLAKIACRDEIVDNGGCYNATSSSATLNSLTAPADCFTPNVAGLYYFTGAIQLNTTNFNVGLVNNIGGTGGTETYASLVYRKSDTANGMVIVSGFANMNGTGNNICLAGYQESGGSINTNDSFYTTYFGGFLVKAT